VQDLAQRIRILEGFLSRRLVALYKISRLGAMHLLLPADSVMEALKRQAAIERILSYDEQSRQTMAAHYTDLRELQAQLMSQQEAKRLRVPSTNARRLPCTASAHTAKLSWPASEASRRSSGQPSRA